MLARLQQLATFSLLAFVSIWAAYFATRGPGVLAPAGLAIALFGYIAVLAWEFTLLYRCYAGRDDRPGVAELAQACLSEAAVAPRVFLWRQPFRSRAIADAPTPAPQFLGRGVVFVHGFICNRGLWNPWMRRMQGEGIPFIAVTLEPVFGSIDRYVATIDAAVLRMTAATGSAPVVVAHSMGGLAVRAWLASGSVERIHRVVTIASPHRGTAMARHSHTENSRQMRLESPWLVRLARSESDNVWRRFICFWSRCDNIVFPTESATLPGADNRHLEATPHVRMAYHPAVVDEVLRLASPAAKST